MSRRRACGSCVPPRHAFAPDDLSSWPGRILLIMAEDDPATPLGAREAMRAMHPRAQVRQFSGTEHATSVLKDEEYVAAVEEFLIPK